MPTKKKDNLPVLNNAIMERNFCEEYMVDLNATAALIRAGYAGDDRALKQQACKMFRKPSVREYLAQLQLELKEKTLVSAEQVILELSRIAFSNIQDFLGDDNEIVDLKTLPRETTAAVASVKKTINTFKELDRSVTTFTLHSKTDALEMLGRYLGLFEADNRQRKPVINVAIINGPAQG